MLHRIINIIFIAFFTILSFSNLAFSQVKEKTFKNWDVYTTTLDGKKMCYIASFPVKKSGNYSKRSEPYFTVTNIATNIDEASASSGYPYKKNSDVKVTIDGVNYNMSLVQGERAWAKDDKLDKTLVQKMKAGNNMSVKGTSLKGTYSLDNYSLSGFTAAYNHMKDLCK